MGSPRLATRHRPHAAEAPRGRESTVAILVIDDDPAAREFVVEVLEEAGYFAVPAPDGETAQRLLGLVRFDVVVSDVVMPGLDGLQLLARIRHEDPTSQVLLMSGQATGATALDAWGHGAAGLLAKPFSPDQLLGAVSEAVGRARLHRRMAVRPSGHSGREEAKESGT